MWNFFTKKQRKQNKKPKKSKYETKKYEAMNEAKKKFDYFHFSYEYINANLDTALFVDEKKRQIGIYKFRNLHINENSKYLTIHFKQLYELGISFGSKVVASLYSNYELGFLVKNQNIEEILKEFKQKLTIDVSNLSLYIRERSDEYEQSDAIFITFYDKKNNNCDFQKNVSELEQAFRLLARHLLDGETEFLAEQKRKKQHEEYRELEARVKYLEQSESVIKGELSDLLTDLVCSWDFIINDLKEETYYKYNFDTLQLKGVRDNKLFIGCNQEYMETMNIPPIKRLVEHVFRIRGFSDIEIISNDKEIEKVSLEDNPLMWEQIYRVLIKNASNDHIQYELKQAKVRSYQNGMLFIDYDGYRIDDLRQWWQYHYKRFLPSTLVALTGINVEVIFVNSIDSIELIPLDNLDKLWEVVIQNVSRKVIWGKYDQEVMQLSKVHSLQDDTLLVYFPKQFRNISYIPFEWATYIQYDLYIHTKKNIFVRVIDNPELDEESSEQPIPEVLLNWINELKAQHEKHFKLMDLRESYGIIVLVDDKLYIHPKGKYILDKSPLVSGLTKDSLRIFEFDSTKQIFIGDTEFSPNPEFEQGIKEYLTELDFDQQEERNKIKQALTTDKVIKLVQRFYIKEMKNRFRPSELVSMFDWDSSFDETIYPLSNFLKKKGYLFGKDYLIDNELRNIMKKVIITDVSSVFLQQYQESFKRIKEMTLHECLKAYRALEFSNVKNDDDVISFTFFLLDHNKIFYDESYYSSTPEPYYKMMQNVRELINDIGEQDDLDEFEAYLYSDDDPSIQEVTIEMIDAMDGYEFEKFIGELFTRMGYNVEITNSSGDYGIDVIARKNGVSIGIQAKCYSNKVSNKAVQEVIAGVSFYKLDKGMVVTNHYFTKQAQNQAINSNIMLWDRNMLNQKIIEFFTSRTKF